MTLKLDLDLVFDGIEQSGARKQDFQRAVQLVKSGKFKSTARDRAAMLDLQLFSDFLSGGARGRQFDPAIQGFFGEPKNLSRYVSPESAPDTELAYEDLVRLFGQEVADQFTFDEDATDPARRTIEIKQKIGKFGTTTFTQLGGGEFSSEIDRIRKQAVIKTKVKDGREVVKASLYDQNKLFNWFESKEQDKFRERLIKQFEQKMQNYLLFSYIDNKLQISAIPGLARKLNLRNKANRRKFTTLEYTGGAQGGSVALRTSAAGNKFIKEQMINVTNQVIAKASDKFLENILKFYLKGDGAKVLKRTGSNTKYGFVNAFAEILLIAKEFDPTFGGKPLELRIQGIDEQSGKISAGAAIAATSAKKKKEKSIVQQTVSDVQVEEIARRAFVSRMPKDRGQPPVPNILTYRTGRFADSFQITRLNAAAAQITYTYDPVYRVHEGTGREPRRLIESGIREAVRQVLKTNDRYKLVRR